jgi:putative DNA primase/helicase
MTQVVGKSAGKNWLTVREGSQYVEETTRRQDQLIDFVRHITKGRSTLVITYKQLDDRCGQIEIVDAAHYGAIEGPDRWRDVEVLIVIGRPLPSSADIEAMAAALTGKPITVGEMVEQTRAVILTSGNACRLPCRVYEAPEAEMTRQAITEAAVVQAVGRARAVNRTSNSPVEVFMILHDTVTPLPVDRVAEFVDLKPDRFDEMVARGLVPEFPGDAAALCPDLFKSDLMRATVPA